MSTRPRGRTRLAAACGVAALLVVGLSSIVRVPPGSLGACGRPGTDSARAAGPGIHLRIPVLETCVVVPSPPFEIRGAVTIASPEGAILEAAYSFRIDPGMARPAAILRLAHRGDLVEGTRSLFESSVHGIEPASLRSGISLLDEAASRRLLEEGLDGLGLVPTSLSVGPLHPRSGTGAPEEAAGPWTALRAGYAGPRQPVLVIGIDSADWTMMGPMIDSGALPALRALRDRGAWGALKSATPTLSPLLWTTVATGKTPDQHGIVDFLAVDAATGKQVPITSRFRRSAALWTILSELGAPSLTVGWWATWPAEKVSGEMVTDRVSYSLMDAGGNVAAGETTYPPALAAEIAPLVIRPEDVTLEETRNIIDIDDAGYRSAKASLRDASSFRDPVAHLLRILAATRTYHGIALSRLRAKQPALSLVYYEGLDEVNHRFAVYEPPAMRWADPEKRQAFRGAVENFYRLQDRLVGELVDAVDRNTVIIVLSDHGFASGDSRPTDVPPDIEGKPGRWHTLRGIILAAGPTVAPGRLPRDPGILDVAPTLLALLSLPVASDMIGKPIPEFVRSGSVPEPLVTSVATYDRPAPPRGGRRAESSSEASPADAEMMAKLTALGYIGAGGEKAEGPDGSPGGSAAPGTITGHLNAANVLLAGGRYAEAEPEYRAALRLAPEYVPARLGLAQCLIGSGREEEGWDALASVLRQGKDLDPTIYMKVAFFFRRHGRAKEGAAVFEKLPPREGLEPARLTARGVLLDASGDAERALLEIRAALREDPSFTEALREIYRILTARRSYEELTSLLEEARRARPEGVVASNLLALTYERAGRGPEAISLLRQVLASSPRDVATLANLAGIVLRGGDVASAMSLLHRAHEIDPGNLEVTANLIIALGRSKDLAGAREVFAGAGESVERAGVLNAMAYACFVNGDLANAKDLVARSLRNDPGQLEARTLLGTIESAIAGSPPSARSPGL